MLNVALQLQCIPFASGLGVLRYQTIGRMIFHPVTALTGLSSRCNR